MTLRITSLLSPASDHRVVELVDRLRSRGMEAEFVGGIWDERFSATRSGDIGAVWVCGLLHVELQAEGDWPFSAVAAPTVIDASGVLRPIYFGRIVVDERSPVEGFDDLAGGRFAYNEETSLSGYRMMLDRLARHGAGVGFFSETLRSGSHVDSLRMVTEDEADCAIIDSLVLDDLAPAGIRVVESVGPYPAPPLAARFGLIPELGAAAVAAGWAPVSESTYDRLREPHGSAG